MIKTWKKKYKKNLPEEYLHIYIYASIQVTGYNN